MINLLKVGAVAFLFTAISNSASATITITDDGESSISELKLQNFETVVEDNYEYLDVYFEANTRCCSAHKTTQKIIKSRISIAYPPEEHGFPIYLLTAVPVDSEYSSGERQIIKDRFLIRSKSANGEWKDNFSWTRGAIYLVKGRNGNGDILSVYKLDMRDRENVRFHLLERDSPIIDTARIMEIAFCSKILTDPNLN